MLLALGYLSDVGNDISWFSCLIIYSEAAWKLVLPVVIGGAAEVSPTCICMSAHKTHPVLCGFRGDGLGSVPFGLQMSNFYSG